MCFVNVEAVSPRRCWFRASAALRAELKMSTLGRRVLLPYFESESEVLPEALLEALSEDSLDVVLEAVDSESLLLVPEMRHPRFFLRLLRRFLWRLFFEASCFLSAALAFFIVAKAFVDFSASLRASAANFPSGASRSSG
jgi:hypothetical protein